MAAVFAFWVSVDAMEMEICAGFLRVLYMQVEVTAG